MPPVARPGPRVTLTYHTGPLAFAASGFAVWVNAGNLAFDDEPRRVSATGGSNFAKPSRRFCKARSESLVSPCELLCEVPDALHFANLLHISNDSHSGFGEHRLRVANRAVHKTTTRNGERK